MAAPSGRSLYSQIGRLWGFRHGPAPPRPTSTPWAHRPPSLQGRPLSSAPPSMTEASGPPPVSSTVAIEQPDLAPLPLTREERFNKYRAQQISEALRTLRGGSTTSGETKRQARLTLGRYVQYLSTKDALLLFEQALEGGLWKLAYETLAGLRERDMEAVLAHLDLILQACAGAGKVYMAQTVLDDVKNHPGCKPPSKATYLALLLMLSEKGRYKTGWEMAVRMMEGVEGAAYDPEVAAMAMRVCWKAQRWSALTRILDSSVEQGSILNGQAMSRGRHRQRTLQNLRALVDTLQGMGAPVYVEYCNMVLRSYLVNGDDEGAISYVRQMLSDCSLPNPDGHSFSLVLDALGKKGDWEACVDLMNQVSDQADLPQVNMVYKTAIAAFGKVGMWEGALSLFYEMHERGISLDAETYTTLMKAMKDGRKWETTLSLLSMMKEQDVTPTRFTYGVVLSALGNAGQVDRALQLFQEMKASGIEATAFEYITLINACGRVGRCETGLDLLHEAVRECGPKSRRQGKEEGGSGEWVGSLPKGEEGEEGRGHDMTYLASCYMGMIKAFGKAGRWKEAATLLDEIRSHGGEPSFSHYYEVMRACAVAGECDATLALLDDMASRHMKVHVLCYNAAFLACERTGRWQDAVSLLSRMWDNRCPPGFINYSRTMAACAKAGLPEKAWQLFQEMRSSGLEPDVATYGVLLRVAGQTGWADKVLATLQEMVAAGVAPDHLTYAHAVGALRACHKLPEMLQVLHRSFTKASGKSLLATNAALLACLESNSPSQAAEVLALMDSHGMRPDTTTVDLIKALCEQAAHDATLLAAARQLLGGEDALASPPSSGGSDVKELARSIETQLAVNPHDPLRRARFGMLGYAPLK